MLADGWAWRRKWDHAFYSDHELIALMEKSTDPSLDGERAENYSLELAGALATVGDQRFAHLHASRSGVVKKAVAFHSHFLWDYYHLLYPETQAILQPFVEKTAP